MYRVVASCGGVVVADVAGLCRPQEGLFRVPLPPLPKGAVHLSVMLNSHPVSFTQTLLVLPAPCAQEMALLWACLLQTRLAAAAQLTQPHTPNTPPQQQQQQPTADAVDAAGG
ncbi:hypothetical protein OEZ85_009434 [Tetradesmus obliquus]|uniref:Uncharacterized protein n=1 Tax=Tetradesmus obliquus TaxID=3088 RepID=A0ABY8UC39_TETOB|nr:hypothetical protein OEZ85_009434 [Tetradesmus obliquus]